MKNYIIIAVFIFAGLGLLWFLMSGDSTRNESEMSSVDTENLDQQGTSDVAVSADPVATVNGEEISNADFNTQQSQALAGQGVDPATLDNETLATVRDQVLDSLISQKLLQQAADNAGVEVSEAEIDAQLNVIRSQFEDGAMYEEALASENLTEAELRMQLAADLSVEPYLEQTLNLSSITVTEEEVNQAYQELSAQQDLPALEQIQSEVEQLVIQQKQQPLIDQHIAQLREVADIEVFI